MKTEKRLTMALSVLVALMMLAVPLASSSNLFVDGGQTNSNGDAPLLNASTPNGDTSKITNLKVWIVDDKESYNKLPDSYKKSNSWDDAKSSTYGLPWLAVVYTLNEAGTADTSISVTYTYNGNTQTLTFTNDNKTANEHYMLFRLNSGDSSGHDLNMNYLNGNAEFDVSITSDKYRVSQSISYFGEDGAARVTFNLNADGKSLDPINVKLPTSVAGYTWHKDVDGNIFAIVSGEDVTVQDLIGAFFTANNSNGKTLNVMKTGYSLDAWTSENGQYDNVVYVAGSNEDLIKGDMTLSAVWTLDSDNYVEIPVNVYVDGTLTGEYTKAYKFDIIDNKLIKFEGSNVLVEASDIPGIDMNGYVVNAIPPSTKPIYTSEVTDANGNKDPKQISVTGSLEIKFTMNTTLYSKITVSSVMFEEDVILYALKSSDYTYKNVFEALKATGDIKVGNVDANNGSYVTSDKYYKITGWNNGAELPDSTRNASDSLTLDAELNSYNVVFMVNGKYEVVKVPYGELSDKLCTIDVSGLNRWVSVDMEDYAGTLTNSSFKTFNFNSSSSIKSVENYAGGLEESDEIAAIFVAVFTTQSSTAYAVFDAGKVDGGKDADFGNKYIDKIIIAGENGKTIPLPSATPSVDAKAILVDWERTVVSGTEKTYTELSEGVTIGTGDNAKEYFNNFEKSTLLTYTASWAPYDYTIILYSGNDVVGVLYVMKGDINGNFKTFEGKIKAIQYKGIIYKGADKLNEVLTAKKDGYALKQWNDADGTKIISYDPSATGNTSKFDLTKDFKSIEGDMSLYAKFDANKYTIVYNNAIAAAINEMKQDGYVDDPLKLLSEATFNNEGHKLLSWNTRADGLGDSYKLGADFTLTGAQYEDLKDKDGNVTITLYAIWDTTPGSGDNPGGSTGGDGDNTALYLIAGMLAIIAILAIVGIVLMRRKN